MVWGLAWRCAIRRCVKKHSNKRGKLGSFCMRQPPSLFQPARGQLHQFRMKGKIPVCIGHMSMAEERGEYGQSPFDIFLGPIPLNQGIQSESVAKIVNPRSS